MDAMRLRTEKQSACLSWGNHLQQRSIAIQRPAICRLDIISSIQCRNMVMSRNLYFVEQTPFPAALPVTPSSSPPPTMNIAPYVPPTLPTPSASPIKSYGSTRRLFDPIKPRPGPKVRTMKKNRSNRSNRKNHSTRKSRKNRKNQ